MCGTTSPTNPIIPQIATLADVARAAAPPAASQIARIFAPEWKACWRPSAIKFSAFAQIAIAAHAAAIAQAAAAISPQPHLSSEPSDQNTYPLSPTSRAEYIKNPTSAPQKAFTAIPDKSVENAETLPPNEPSLYTANAAASPPISAHDSSANGYAKNDIATTAPSAAPEDTPSMDGSASGFLKRLCMQQPAIARHAPDRMPAARRGRRI